MQTFGCAACGAELFFESSVCLTCGRPCAYDRGERRMVVPDPGGSVCANLDLAGCNWLADPGSSSGLCFCCRLTRTRPADDDPRGLAGLWVAEGAKRRLVYGLDQVGLPVAVSDGYHGLAFDLLSSNRGPVTTGYHNGVITLDLAESDDGSRESRRVSLREPYRTVLGHLRHELGHYYCELLVLTAGRRDAFVALFGDETVSYAGALAEHYRGPGRARPDGVVSTYATMHPLEDFAETFAHFLHICDALQTAAAFGLSAAADPSVPFSQTVVELWLPLAKGANQLNRSLGRPDLYPFVLSDSVLAKLDFVADVVSAAR